MKKMILSLFLAASSFASSAMALPTDRAITVKMSGSTQKDIATAGDRISELGDFFKGRLLDFVIEGEMDTSTINIELKYGPMVFHLDAFVDGVRPATARAERISALSLGLAKVDLKRTPNSVILNELTMVDGSTPNEADLTFARQFTSGISGRVLSQAGKHN